MLIRLLPNTNGKQPSQIVIFWETIKFACQKADVIHIENYQVYFNELLHALLSDKAQCFVRIDDKRIIIGILITRITGNKVTGEKSLRLQSAYSFRSESQEIWAEDFKTILDIAKERDCKKITFETSNDKIASLGESVGCKEISRMYEYVI